jgi:uncharacterized protein YndB with AHSA1/START domain
MDIVLPQPPEKVWRALTDARALAQWLMPNDFHPRLGHRFRFTPERDRKRENGGAIQCEVVELEAPCRLAYTWRETPTEAPDLVTWVLEPVEAGTRVRLEHTRLTDLRACASAALYPADSSAVPAELVSRLTAFLAGKSPRKRRARGKIVLSGGSAFVCVAISPYRNQEQELSPLPELGSGLEIR